jgi:hypothetical protein
MRQTNREKQRMRQADREEQRMRQTDWKQIKIGVTFEKRLCPSDGGFKI